MRTETVDAAKIHAEDKDKVAKHKEWNDWAALVHWHKSNELEREIKDDYIDEVVTVAIASLSKEIERLKAENERRKSAIVKGNDLYANIAWDEERTPLMKAIEQIAELKKENERL